MQTPAEGFYSPFGIIYSQKDSQHLDWQFYTGGGMIGSIGETNGCQYPNAVFIPLSIGKA